MPKYYLHTWALRRLQYTPEKIGAENQQSTQVNEMFLISLSHEKAVFEYRKIRS